MRYHTPELLLVGSAQNVVLDPTGGNSNNSSCRLDNKAVPTESDLFELW